MKSEIIKNIYDKKIVAIVRGLSKEEAVNTAKALAAGGINMIEVTFDQTSKDGYKDTLEAIKTISTMMNDEVYVGAGTVLTVEQVDMAYEVGAQYIITPSVDAEVIKHANELGMVTMPGALSPTEIEEAYKAGADFVKVFPCGNMGADYIKAVKAPLKHIPLLAVGGVNLENIESFIKAGVVGFGLGGNLVNQTYIKEGNYDEITKTAKEFVSAVKN
uniref:bifunctional 4-hydroxy-2-oxoglutarate aldolase/2-dehydro-3-deoxy-phosphogluconate aldolase n=1 Tax=Roseburia inulinivorans TaxID=360807 RepID=UPI00402961A4